MRLQQKLTVSIAVALATLLAKLRVNPRPIGRGQCALWVYKREPRSGSILVYSDSAHTLSVFR